MVPTVGAGTDVARGRPPMDGLARRRRSDRCVRQPSARRWKRRRQRLRPSWLQREYQLGSRKQRFGIYERRRDFEQHRRVVWIGALAAVEGGSPGVTAGDAMTGAASGASFEGGASGSDGGGSATPSTGIFPPVTDPGVSGPFTPTTTGSTGPNGNYTAFYPKELGQDGVKNPIVIWGDGATLTPTSYLTLLNHLVSHGFAILAYNATPQGSDMTAAIDWMVAEDARQGSIFYGKLDPTKIASMGHSAGSLATFAIANDPRLTTTMHLDGGTMSPHTDAKNLVKPAAFICGDSGGDGLITGDVARPNCDIDFQNATTPVWYGDIVGASHLTVTGSSATDPKLKAFLTATAAWLRWQLAADQTMKAFFVPSATCTLCTQTSVWTVQEKDLL